MEYLPQVKLFPKVRKLLRRIQQDGRKIALASSAKKMNGMSIKKSPDRGSHRSRYFVRRVKQSKPHPDIFEAALSKLGGIALHKIVTVRDTPYDAEAAANANMRIIGLLTGGWTEEHLREAGCIEVYRHLADLLAHYEHSVFQSTPESK
jgi:phosphoglycolate phosphatase-like HAD superfamily hydrolase